ncbi:MAG: hydrolase 1, exosortase A system-associated [bacterium]
MEKPVQFALGHKLLYGILHLPVREHDVVKIVLMVIGGPQTRVGSHRLYAQLARALCDEGVAVYRFDYEGMGDSEGNFVGFEFAGPSIRAAMDYLFGTLSSLQEAIVWSLCDGAAASVMYAPSDRQRITAMILCNPYVHTEQGQAKTILRHYYIRRLLDGEFWQKVFSFRFDAGASFRSFRDLVQKTRSRANGAATGGEPKPPEPLPDRVIRGLCAFNRPVRVLLSTNDLTAMEFRDLLQSRAEVQPLLRNKTLTLQFIEGADHTFSNREAKRLALAQTLAALRAFDQAQTPAGMPGRMQVIPA